MTTMKPDEITVGGTYATLVPNVVVEIVGVTEGTVQYRFCHADARRVMTFSTPLSELLTWVTCRVGT